MKLLFWASMLFTIANILFVVAICIKTNIYVQMLNSREKYYEQKGGEKVEASIFWGRVGLFIVCHISSATMLTLVFLAFLTLLFNMPFVQAVAVAIVLGFATDIVLYEVLYKKRIKRQVFL